MTITGAPATCPATAWTGAFIGWDEVADGSGEAPGDGAADGLPGDALGKGELLGEGETVGGAVWLMVTKKLRWALMTPLGVDWSASTS
jgi:hypothetical protein